MICSIQIVPLQNNCYYLIVNKCLKKEKDVNWNRRVWSRPLLWMAVPVLMDPKWLMDLACLVDITQGAECIEEEVTRPGGS